MDVDPVKAGIAFVTGQVDGEGAIRDYIDYVRARQSGDFVSARNALVRIRKKAEVLGSVSLQPI